MPRNYLGQRSQTGGTGWGWEVLFSLKTYLIWGSIVFLFLFFKLVVNIKKIKTQKSKFPGSLEKYEDLSPVPHSQSNHATIRVERSQQPEVGAGLSILGSFRPRLHFCLLIKVHFFILQCGNRLVKTGLLEATQFTTAHGVSGNRIPGSQPASCPP